MSTIANQINRISEATKKLRNKGISLGLEVSENVALNENHKIDDVAKAFDGIKYTQDADIRVELEVVTDGVNYIGKSENLKPGFYRGCKITPYFKQSNVSDFVINVETINNYSIGSQTGVIKPTKNPDDPDNPARGFNYIDEVSFKVQDCTMAYSSYTNNSVIINVSKAGWVSAGDKEFTGIPTSTLKSKVGTGSTTEHTSNSVSIAPDLNAATVITIGAGIYTKNRTVTIASTPYQGGNVTATAADILKDKYAYGKDANNKIARIKGTMPNYGGTSSTNKLDTAASSASLINSKIVVVPKKGYYNEYSTISTNLTAGPAKYTVVAADLTSDKHSFVIIPDDDEDKAKTTYLTEVTIDNSYIYNLLKLI